MNAATRFLLPALLALLSAAPAAAQQATLRPGDAVRVEIWREADLSGDWPVGVDGSVTFPLLGRMQVTDIPLAQLRDTLLSLYQVQLRNPSINVTPVRRVTVLGAVAKPGLYGADPTLALAGLIATAGGATPEGSLERIRIVRNGQVLRERVGAGETLDQADILSGDQVIVEQKSWFTRNMTFVVSTLISVSSIVTSIILSR
jgi:protein involved in polysaccharide export with SLBB domain